MVASRAVRASAGSVSRSRRLADHRALTRNILIAGLSLTGLATGSASLALFGGDSFGAPSPYIDSRSALKVALADPAAPARAARDPRAPLDVPETRTTIAVRSEPDAHTQAPQVRREQPRPAVKSDKAATVPGRKAEVNAPIRQTLARIDPPEPPQTQMALASIPNADDPAVTGSLGPAAAPRSVKVVSFVQDKLAALAKPVLAIKPSRAMTPHQKLYGPVRVASLNPGMTMRDAKGLPAAPYDLQTAVYVITDKKVYMPDGTSLEAHSGLGDKMDDPRFVHVRMQGATPPHVYDMKMREALFHGVEAIRLTPMQGEDAIFGRDGLLTHSYLLGPSGQSNGCISFKDYDAFLQAFKAGKITRIAVLAKLD
jgi:hypothetical protein